MTGILRNRFITCIERSAYFVGATAVLVAILVSSGCQHKPAGRSDRAAITGSVTYKGTPLRGGTMVFTSASDNAAMATCIIKADGTYSVADAPLGETHVAIETKSIIQGDPGRYVEIPTKYGAAQTSNLTCTIKQGENKNVDFNLD